MTGIQKLRQKYHKELCRRVIFMKKGNIPGMADVDNKRSIELARGIVERLAYPTCPDQLDGQTAGNLFKQVTRDYLEEAFAVLLHLRPGNWQFSVEANIRNYDQYQHLAELTDLVKTHKQLATILGDYLVTPDIVVARIPVSDEEINHHQPLVQKGDLPKYAPLRAANSSAPLPILHASLSCKWTIRSDRSQVARTEGTTLIRNRKGHIPHIVAVTGEPLPSRLASLAMGTGDIDCVYHFALHELTSAVEEAKDDSLMDILMMMMEGRRLRDIADLPFDLAV